MKLHLVFLFFIFLLSSFSFTALSQPKQLQMADEYFNDFNYKKALRAYTELEKEGVALYYVTHKIGDCCKYMGKTQEAIDWYLKAISYPDADYTTYYILSHELRKMKRYAEAEEYLSKYNKLSGRAAPEIKRSAEELIFQLKEDSSNYIIHSLSINSEFSEFGPTLYKDQLVFSSNRKNIQAVRRQDIRDGSNFYKLFASKRNGLTSLLQPKMFNQNLSSKYNDGPIAFNQDQNISFTTRNVITSSKEKSYLSIFVNNKVGGKWKSKSTVIPLRQVNFSYMHAFMTANDERLFFVSDMEGGYGGLDIYYSYYKNGFLSTPVNLGPNINSEANEMTPFVSQNGKLYFSSDKNGGLGGLDVYVAMPEGEGFSQGFNMGYPINTSADDFGLIYENVGLSGYFVSNREGGIGKDDIYAFQQRKEISYIRYSGIVLSEGSGKPVDQALVAVYEGGKVISSVKTNDLGKFYFYIRYTANLSLQIKKRYFNHYKTDLKSVAKPNNDGYSIQVLLKEY